MESSIKSISSNSNNIRQDVFPWDQWTITTRKGIIMQSKCTCKHDVASDEPKLSDDDSKIKCDICRHYEQLPKLRNMPDMLFNNNSLKLEHFSGIGIEFNALDALKSVEDTQDPLKVAVADGWQSARADFPFAKSIIKPFDWTFTSDYKGTIISCTKKSQFKRSSEKSDCITNMISVAESENSAIEPEDRLCFSIEETDERIDVNKLKVRDEILFYDDVALYEDELADHGTTQYNVKIRVMPRSLFILARFYLRVDGVLARINDTRIYHEHNKRYVLREYTNREARLSSLNLPISILVDPNELMAHLPVIRSKYEKLTLPSFR